MPAPRISLILAVRDEAALTVRCLTRLSELPEDPPFEVVVVDDGSRDGTAGLLAGLEGDVQVLTHGEPAGYGRSCDRAVEAARGELVVLVAQRALPCAGWLDELVAALDADPAIVAALPRSVDRQGVFLADAHWLALAVRRTAYLAAGGFGGTGQAGRAEKASLLAALGAVAPTPCSLLIAA